MTTKNTNGKCTCGQSSSETSGKKSGGSWMWWIAGAVALVLASGGGLKAGSGDAPATHGNGQCTQYFKGGC